jgi:hypothetical protein
MKFVRSYPVVMALLAGALLPAAAVAHPMPSPPRVTAPVHIPRVDVSGAVRAGVEGATRSTSRSGGDTSGKHQSGRTEGRGSDKEGGAATPISSDIASAKTRYRELGDEMARLDRQMSETNAQILDSHAVYVARLPAAQREALDRAHADLADINRELNRTPDMPFDQWKNLANAKEAAQAKIDEGAKAFRSWQQEQYGGSQRMIDTAQRDAARDGLSARLQQARAERRELAVRLGFALSNSQFEVLLMLPVR